MEPRSRTGCSRWASPVSRDGVALRLQPASARLMRTSASVEPAPIRARAARINGPRSRPRDLPRAWWLHPRCPRWSRGDAPGDGLRKIVHRHGVAHAAVVARDHFEILEAHAVGGTESRSRPAPAAPASSKRCAVSKVTPLDFRPATVSFSARLPGSAVTGASGCSTASASTGPSGDPAECLEVVSDARDDVVPVGEQVALLVVAAVDRVAAVARRHELRRAHGAGVRAERGQRIDRFLARQRDELRELAAEEFRARWIVEGEGGERIEHAVLAGDAAVEGFDADDRHHVFRRDAGGLVRLSRAGCDARA